LAFVIDIYYTIARIFYSVAGDLNCIQSPTKNIPFAQAYFELLLIAQKAPIIN